MLSPGLAADDAIADLAALFASDLAAAHSPVNLVQFAQSLRFLHTDPPLGHIGIQIFDHVLHTLL